MAFRSDVTVDWNVSPRIVTVLDPSTEITLQDLHDTLVDHEDEPAAMSYDRIVRSEGKNPLGGGLFVGITTVLLNAVLAFQARKIWTDVGTITTSDAGGRTLIDAAATFITAGVLPGSLVVNLTDGSLATVLRVTSQTQLVTDMLGGGADNGFDIADAYRIINPVQCTVSGGNLLAVDINGAPMSPVLSTAGTFVSRVSSTSAALLDAGAAADPWSTLLPGLYPINSAGYRLANVNNTVQAALTAQGYTAARAPKLDSIDDAATIAALVAGTGLTAQQATMLLELHKLAGLDPAKPLVISATSRKVPGSGADINQTIQEAAGVVTITRS